MAILLDTNIAIHLRLIAATAIVHDLTLVTVNGADFRDVPGLRLETWPGAAQ